MSDDFRLVRAVKWRIKVTTNAKRIAGAVLPVAATATILFYYSRQNTVTGFTMFLSLKQTIAVYKRFQQPLPKRFVLIIQMVDQL